MTEFQNLRVGSFWALKTHSTIGCPPFLLWIQHVKEHPASGLKSLDYCYLFSLSSVWYKEARSKRKSVISSCAPLASQSNPLPNKMVWLLHTSHHRATFRSLWRRIESRAIILHTCLFSTSFTVPDIISTAVVHASGGCLATLSHHLLCGRHIHSHITSLLPRCVCVPGTSV